MEDAVLKIEHLSHRYSASWAVRDVNFEVNRHDICGLLGSNGAGKSTIMNIVCGILRQMSGKVTVAGIDIRENPLEAKKHLGFLPQNPPIYMDFTVEEYLVHAAEMRRIPDKVIPEAVKDVMEKCGVVHFRNRLLKNLSGGYRQRVGIAQAIIHKPDLVVFDEPTNGLDPMQVLAVRQLLREIARTSTVLISTHILSEVQAVCNKIVMVERGKLIFKGSVGDFDNYIVPDTILVKVHSEHGPVMWDGIAAISGVESLGDDCYRVRFADEAEAMENIVSICVEKGWHLEEMTLERSSLDVIFSELTKKRSKK